MDERLDLPSGWPPWLPLPAGCAAVSDEGDADVLRVQFSIETRIDLRGFFERELTDADWAIEASSDGSLEIEGHGFFGQIEIADDRTFWIQIVG